MLRSMEAFETGRVEAVLPEVHPLVDRSNGRLILVLASPDGTADGKWRPAIGARSHRTCNRAHSRDIIAV
jgi:hypothetical protein